MCQYWMECVERKIFFPWFLQSDVLKFHDFGLFSQFHDFSRSGKCFFHFLGFPWFSRPLGTLKEHSICEMIIRINLLIPHSQTNGCWEFKQMGECYQIYFLPVLLKLCSEAILSYPMTHILSQSEATKTRCIYDPIYLYFGSWVVVYGSHFECHWWYMTFWINALYHSGVVGYGIYAMRQTHVPLPPRGIISNNIMSGSSHVTHHVPYYPHV